jgi:hypothetical protein
MTQIRDWATTVFTDDVGCNGSDPCQTVVSNPTFQEPSWNHRSIFPRLCTNSSCSATLGKYPLQLTPLTDQSPATLNLVAGGAAYFRFTVPAGSKASVDWSSAGLPVSPFVQFTVVRTR